MSNKNQRTTKRFASHQNNVRLIDAPQQLEDRSLLAEP
jgi:hypothetical protein